jgi:signal peptidase II
VRDVQSRRALGSLIGVAAAVVAVDHATKWWALRELTGRDIDLVWTLRLRLVFNRGGAFGLGSKFAPLIALVAAAVVIGLFVRRDQLGQGLSTFGVALLMGGAVGNLLDRVFRDGHGFLGGAVIDFVDLRWWPVFNVADMAITLGALVLALASWRTT